MHPKASDYFVCPPEVVKALSLPEKPRELPIMFPSDDHERLFPQSYKMYRRAGLYCAGDGETAKRWDDTGNLTERPCPCEYLDSEECGPVATLNFLLPDVPGIGIYQITTGNKASIVSLNTAFDEFTVMFGGLRGIPFLLKLEPAQTMRWNRDKRQMEKVIVQALRLDSPYTLRQILDWRRALGKPVEALMPAPDEEAIEVHAERVVDAGVPPKQEEPDSIRDAREAPPPAPAGEAHATSPGPAQEKPERDAKPAGAGPSGGLPREANPDEPPVDISMCYRWAAQCGMTAELYERYFEAHHGVRTGDAPDALVAREAAEFQALGSESARLAHKATLIRRLNEALKAKGARR